MNVTFSVVRPEAEDAAGNLLAHEAGKIAGIALEACIKRHIARLSGSKHATATRLGATPTGHYDASAVSLAASSASTAEVAVAIPGISRAYNDVAIRPTGGSKALAIPVSAETYGMRAREWSLRNPGRLFRPKGARYLVADMAVKTGRGRNAKSAPATRLLYILAAQVRQRRDPSLMPTDEEAAAASAKGVKLALEGL